MNCKSQTSINSPKAIFFLCAALLFSTESSAQMLSPARSVYELQLNNDRDNGKIYAATGQLVVELIEHCDGFIFNQGYISKISTIGSNDLVNNMEASIWESRDGRTLRFNMTNKINGTIIEQEQGRADMPENGSGKAVWQLPQSRTLMLPAGTLFPVGYNRLVLQRALSGSNGFEMPLFDGGNNAGFYHAAAFIGPIQKGKSSTKVRKSDLRSWSVRLAYYNYNNLIGLPDFEIGYMLFEDGIVDNLRLDYPNFGLIGHLKELNYLDQPKCE